MTKFRLTLVILVIAALKTTVLPAASLEDAVGRLIKSSCLQCHDADTSTDLNFEQLGFDLANRETFRIWERVFDRVRSGEMPPPAEVRPNAQIAKAATEALQQHLRTASVERQKHSGRVPARRLTKLEFGYTLRDLLLIDGDVTSGIPDEVESGTFDTVGAGQRISAVHMEAFLKAADEALEQAIRLGKNPHYSARNDYAYLEEWHEKDLNLGGNITRKLPSGEGVALFRDIDYLTGFQFRVNSPGMHRLTAKVEAYQSKTPVTAKFIIKNQSSGGARVAKLIDLEPDEPQTVVVETFMKPGDSAYVTFDMDGKEPFTGIIAAGGAKYYKGRGLAIHSQQVEGPLFDSWPPDSTRELLHIVTFSGSESFSKIKPVERPTRVLNDTVHRFAIRAFRRDVPRKETQPFAALARPSLSTGSDLSDAIPIAIRAILSSPQFLMFDNQPGKLNDVALANRLSYFVWKSLPDDELMKLARRGRLSNDKALMAQLDRMLADDKSQRFVRDFLGQWLRLYKLNITTPDEKLYPEYDELLSEAVPREPQLFFTDLIDKNLSLLNVIDSDFTFVNRRLAAHYKLPAVKGQDFQRVPLPDDSPRGGMLTQAAILKTTANGTTTSPVMRGNFVLTSILGTPPSPPPPDIGSIEPDIRGKTTIREILAAHREIDSCNVCHREIDPPGFALESFDPIGGYRTNYRSTGGNMWSFMTQKQYHTGPKVDCTGITSDGKTFANVQEFKTLLLEQREQIARHFISQLVVYGTGAEIQFADRDEIEALLDRTREANFPVRDIIHEIVRSRLFRNL